MHRFKQALTISLCLFLLYTAKSAAGINLSKRYHAIDLVRIPTKFVIYQAKNVVHKFRPPEQC